MYFIDTNIFLRVLVKEDEISFSECFKLLSAIKHNKVEGITSTLVISEIVWTLGSYYKISKEEIARMVRGILNLSGLKIVDGYSLIKALDWYETKNIKYIDAVLASMPQFSNSKWKMVSYDKDFDKLKLKRVEPRQAM